MDPRLLSYYSRELRYIREMGSEFAAEFPKIADRLGMEGDVADPYVERLLEGFAFLAARVHLKIDSEFPTFSQNLLEIVFPHYLAPVPSMAVVQFDPILEALTDGFCLPRDMELQATKTRGQQTACKYLTGHEVTFWPIEVTEAKYFGSAGALATAKIEAPAGVRAGIRLSLRTVGGVAFDQLSLDSLRFYLKGSDDLSSKIYEQLLGNAISILVRPKGGADPWQGHLGCDCIRPVGFQQEERLLPHTERSFTGYRYLQEYFAFPERFLFVDFHGLLPHIRRCTSTELEIVVLLDRRDVELDGHVSATDFALNCAPVVNLFAKTASSIPLDDHRHEYHVVPDRTVPMDLEVWGITDVQGFGSGATPQQSFQPFYAQRDATAGEERAFYTITRKPRVLSSIQRRKGTRSQYIGSEVSVALVDPQQAPYRTGMRRIEVRTLCTNRDLPRLLKTQGQTEFTLDTGAPVESIRCVAGPSAPRPSYAQRDRAWRLINHLSLNYLSLINMEEDDGARAFRSLLSLYIDDEDPAGVRMIEGLVAVDAKPVNRRVPAAGPVTFGRGLEVSLTCEESSFEGTGLFLFGQVMEEFLAKYVSLNSFTETVLLSTSRGEIKRWPPRLGQRQVL